MYSQSTKSPQISKNRIRFLLYLSNGTAILKQVQSWIYARLTSRGACIVWQRADAFTDPVSDVLDNRLTACV